MVDNRPVLHSPWFLTNTTQNACLAVQLSKNNTKFSPQPCEQPLKYILCQGTSIGRSTSTYHRLHVCCIDVQVAFLK